MTVLIQTSFDELPLQSVYRYLGLVMGEEASGRVLASCGPSPSEADEKNARAKGEQEATVYLAACESLLEGRRHAELLQKMLGASPQLFSSENAGDRDIECCFGVECDLLSQLLEGRGATKALDSAAAVRLTEEAANAICGGGKKEEFGVDHLELRLDILVQLFNSLRSAGQSRACAVTFKRLVEFADKAGLSEGLLPHMGRVEGWLAEWEAPDEQRRAIYLALSDMLRNLARTKSAQDEAAGGGLTGGNIESLMRDAYALLVKYLRTFNGGDKSALEAVRAPAVRAAVEFIKTPGQYRCDLMTCSAVQHLSEDALYKPVYTLLSVFLSGRLNDMITFDRENVGFLEKMKLDKGEVFKKMRIVCLADLMSKAGAGNEVSYADLSEALAVDVDEAEEWVMRAVEAGVVEARMDQMRECCIVDRAIMISSSGMGREEWTMLQTRLGEWEATLIDLNERIDEAYATQVASVHESFDDGMAPMQGIAA